MSYCITRRNFLTHAGALLGAAYAGCATAQLSPLPSASGARRKPNIIFILADDLGYGDVGCYGQQQILTPNIDRLAKEGMRFTNCYAASTVCAPSRCALMTGLHTGHCLIRGNADVPLRRQDVTVAEVLKSAGYTTGLIGKWGLGLEGTTGEPKKKGFDYSFGYLDQGHAHNYYPDYLFRNGERVEIPENTQIKKGVAAERVTYSHDLFAQEALDFVRLHKDERFFLYLAFTIPHTNNERGAYDGNGMEVPSDAPYTEKDWSQPQKNHAAMITRMDKDIGNLMQLLKELDLDSDTLVFFSSDNGPHKEGGGDPEFFNSSGSLRGFKRALYDGGIRIPAIARWPGRIPAGAVNDFVWAFWDVLPTLADVAFASPPEGLDGVSILPTMTGGRPQQTHEFLYWEFHEKGFVQAARHGNWKAVRYWGQPLELYDIATDPSESRNVASAHPDVVAAVTAYLDTARTPSERWPGPTAP